MTTSTNINDEKFKIQGVGIDTSTIITKPWLEEGGEIFDYIHTSISVNNDFLLSEYIKNQPGAALITTIDFISNPERALLGHVIELERKKIDLLLVSGDALENKIDEFDDAFCTAVARCRFCTEDEGCRVKIGNRTFFDAVVQVKDRECI